MPRKNKFAVKSNNQGDELKKAEQDRSLSPN